MGGTILGLARLVGGAGKVLTACALGRSARPRLERVLLAGRQGAGRYFSGIQVTEKVTALGGARARVSFFFF